MGKLGVTLATYLREERRKTSLQNPAPELICAVIMVEFLEFEGPENVSLVCCRYRDTKITYRVILTQVERRESRNAVTVSNERMIVDLAVHQKALSGRL